MKSSNETSLQKLITLAKGEDRTVREYAEAAGVNFTTLYRAINGECIPTAKVMQKITSPAAAPRNGVTYESLKKASDVNSAKKQQSTFIEDVILDTIFSTTFAASDLVAGAGIAALPFSAVIGAVPLTFAIAKTLANANARKDNSPKKAKEKAEKQMADIQQSISQFSAIGIGLIYNALLKKGIGFKPVNDENISPLFQEKDIQLEITSDSVSSWYFTFITTTDDTDITQAIEKTMNLYLQNLFFQVPDPTVKYSFVVNSSQLYNLLLTYKDKISLKANLSVINIDPVHVAIVDETTISSYSDAPSSMPSLI